MKFFARSPQARRDRSRGQVVVIFAGAAIILFTLTALVIDLSWYWANTLRVQRAADAAALAGVVWLPGQVPTALTYAATEATKNGYTDAGNSPCVVGTVCVDPEQDPGDTRQLDVTISAPVKTFFMRLIGINSITATRFSKAVYVQKVPMGSPLTWYGVGCFDLKTGTAPLCSTGSSTDRSGVPLSPTYAGAMPAANTSVSIFSQGFWGSVQTKGGNRSNGDAFSPYYNGNPTLNNPANNGATPVDSEYEKAGYDYTVTFASAGGRVDVFDPTFCSMGSNPAGNGNYGAGDHWLSGTNPVSTYYTLWDTKGTSFTTLDDTIVASSGTLFESLTQSDQSNDGTGGTNCAANAYHNKWWQVGQGAVGCTFDATAVPAPGFSCGSAPTLAAGTYRLQVQTSKEFPYVANGSINQSTDAENMFSIMATNGGATGVYGAGRMASYNNLNAGVQLFYLAQIDRTAAGKTLEIDLFDPGDVQGDATLRILSPDGNTYDPVSFSYSTSSTCNSSKSDACSAPLGRTSIKTAVGGQSSFGNTWIQILVPLPASYGCIAPAAVCLTPPGEPGAGWWKIEYTVGDASDLTTWQVNVRGNPVHLIIP